jgi:5-methylcytosine-specific restriction endonuclease McrA
MPRCHDCQHYDNLTKKATGGGVEFTREEFVAWKRGDPANRRCAYCGIDGAILVQLGIINVRNKKPYEVIGVDRVDNSRPYRLDNIVACCGPCNAIKGSILTDFEMRLLGPTLRQVWDARL